RQYAAGARFRRHLSPHHPRPRHVRRRHAGRAPDDPLAHLRPAAVKAMDVSPRAEGNVAIAAWQRFAAGVLAKAGLADEPANAVARGLAEGDASGHSTHGLALLSDYVEEIDSGRMTKSGRPEVLADAGAAVTWDARRLPGVWTTMLAVDEAVRRATAHGVGAV